MGDGRRTRIKERFIIHDNEYLRHGLAEFAGTFILMCLVTAINAQQRVGEITNNANKNLPELIPLATGCAVAMAVWVSGGVSGGHINPAVTLAFGVLGRCRPWQILINMAFQYLAAIAASAVVYGTYHDTLMRVCNGTKLTPVNPCSTAEIFATYPAPGSNVQETLANEITATAILMTSVMALSDKNSSFAPPDHLLPLCIALLLWVMTSSFNYITGCAMNPARDLGPRIFTSMAGYGIAPFSYNNYKWFWVPVVGPHIGAIIGALFYQLLLGAPNSPSLQRKPVKGIPVTESKAQICNGIDNDAFNNEKENIDTIYM